MKTFLALAALALLLTGCTNVTVRTSPGVELAKYHRIFVEQPLNENHHVDEILAYELRQLGYDATSGPLTMMPENTELVVGYTSRWTWDFTTYLIELDVSVRTAHINKVLAAGRYYQPSARPRTAETVAHDLVGRLFPPAPKP